MLNCCREWQVIKAYYAGRFWRIVPPYLVLLAVQLLIQVWIRHAPPTGTYEGSQLTQYWLMGHSRYVHQLGNAAQLGGMASSG